MICSRRLLIVGRRDGVAAPIEGMMGSAGVSVFGSKLVRGVEPGAEEGELGRGGGFGDLGRVGVVG